MTKVYLTEFSSYSLSSMKKFLEIQEETHFRICLPKYTCSLNSSTFKVCSEYLDAAWVGHELAGISSSFMCEVPTLGRNGFFVFEIITENIKGLANILYLAAGGIYTYNPDFRKYGHVHELMTAFFQQVSDGSLVAASGEILDVVNRLMMDISSQLPQS